MLVLHGYVRMKGELENVFVNGNAAARSQVKSDHSTSGGAAGRQQIRVALIKEIAR